MTLKHISMSGHQNSRYLITHRNFFRKQTTKQKKEKKDAFFASVEERRQSRFFAKKYSFWRVAEKRKIFFQKPAGLDLDGQAERAKFASFF